MLNDEDIIKLRSYVDTGDRISYYQYLIDKGDRYAALALGVVTNSNLAGAVANAFAVQKASEIANRELTNSDLAQISLDLMQADFNARLLSSDGLIGRSQIAQYHIDVFAAHNLPPEAWTAYIPLSLAETEGTADALWDQLLDPSFYSANSFVDQVALLVGNKLNDPVLGGGWNEDVASAFVVAATTGSGSNAYGNFQLSWGEVGNVIGGSQYSDTLIGTDLNDVIMTFDGGNQSVDGGGGNDRIHGGFYVDELKGGEGHDTILGYEEDDRIIGGHGSDYIDGGDGNDVITAGELEELAPGVMVHVDRGNDAIFAGDGRDTVEIVAGYDVVSLGNGDDEISIQSRSGQAVVWGGAGSDTFKFSVGGTVLFIDAPNVSDELLENLDQEALRDYLRGLSPIFQEAIISAIVVNVEVADKVYYGDELLDLFTIEEKRTDINAGDWIFDYAATGETSGEGYEIYRATSQFKVSGYTIDRSFKVGDNEDLLVSAGFGDFAEVRVGNLSMFGFTNGDAGITIPESQAVYEEHIVKTTRAIGDPGTGFAGSYIFDHVHKRIYYEPSSYVVVGDEATEVTSTYGSDLAPLGFYSGTRPQIDLAQFQKDPADPPQEDPIEGTDDDDILTGSVNNDLIYGGSGDDQIDGRAGSDLISGDAGDDIINGGRGSDTYLYASGDGNDYIGEDNNVGTDTDALRFADLNITDVDFRRSGVSLIGVVTGTGETIFIDNQFSTDQGGYWGIERIEFADGSSWDYQQISDIGWVRGTAGNDTLVGTWQQEILAGGAGDDSLSGGWGSDTYVYVAGDGHDIIEDWDDPESTDVLSLGPGIDPNQVSIMRGSSGFWDIVLGFSTVGSVTIRNGFYAASSIIEQVKFSDGTLWSLTDLRQRFLAQAATSGNDQIYGFVEDDVIHGGAGSDTIDGLSGNDTLSGEAGDDVLIGEEGNDTLIGGTGADTVVGGAGSDIYVYASGDGYDYLSDGSNDSSDLDVLRLTDLNQSDVDFRRAGLSLIMTVQANGETIYINNQFSTDQGGYWGIERIEFADGSAWDNQRINDIGWIRGTAGNDNLVGTWRQEILAGGGGDDNLTGDWGNDTYVFNAGEGNDTIHDWGNSEATDVLQLGAGIEAGSVAVGRGTAGFWDVVLNFGTAGSVTIADGFYGAATVIEEVRFADNTVWTLNDLQAIHLQQATTSGADTIFGFIDRDDVMEGGNGNDSLTGFSGNDTLIGGAGDDSLSGDDGDDILIGGAGNDSMAGGAGNDVFVFRPGFGMDAIADFTAGAGIDDVLEFDNTLFADFEAVLAAASQVGSDTVIAFDAANSVTLKNV
ncbi:hypothetical protein I6F11_29845, partial [Ensifer sp. NBAIM29]|nr:hypothetical protein [Ensifer sp. NBAIM29]